MQLWEALFEFFWIFGVRMGARWAPFWRKKASFWRSEFLMRFGVRGGSILGGVGGMADLPGKTRSMLKLARFSESVRHASLPLKGGGVLC